MIYAVSESALKYSGSRFVSSVLGVPFALLECFDKKTIPAGITDAELKDGKAAKLKSTLLH